jgi:capsular exopolysaccharide synthesis family protein
MTPYEGSSERRGAAAQQRPERSLPLEEVPRLLRRRKWLIMLVMGLGISLAAAFMLAVPPRYKAQTALLVEGGAASVLDLEKVLMNQPQDESRLVSQLTVLKSRKLAERVVARLNLESDPEFNHALRPASVVDTVLAQVNGASAWLTGRPQPDRERSAIQQRQRTIDEFLDRVRVVQVPGSRTIVVTFSSLQPDLAAQAVNALAEEYLLAALEERYESAQRSSAWLAERAQVLRDQVRQSEAAVEGYRQRHGLLEGQQRQTLISQRVSDLTARVTDSAAERASAEASLAQARRLLQSRDDLTGLNAVLQSEVVAKFREEELALERRAAEMAERFGPRHPQMIQVEAEQRRLDDKIRAEIARIVRGLESQVRVASARESIFRKDLQQLEDQLGQSNVAAVNLRGLEREAEANRLLLEKVLTTLMETSTRQDAQSHIPNATVISAAAIPEKPYFPNPLLIFPLAVIASSMLAVFAALLLEYFDAGYRSAEQLEADSGLPVLALVPYVRTQNASKEVIRWPQGAFSEAVRSIYARLLLAYGREDLKVVQFISAEANEGKSTLALSLVRQQAQLGRRVLLIDADFRRSTIAQIAGVAAAPGLSDLMLSGAPDGAAVEDLIQKDTVSPADILVAGQQPIERLDLLGSRRLHMVIEGLRERYDLIIVDSPPGLAPADANVIASLVDIAVMVVRWGVTRRRVVCYTLDSVRTFGGSVGACVLSMVDLKRHADYGYGDASYYARSYSAPRRTG